MTKEEAKQKRIDDRRAAAAAAAEAAAAARAQERKDQAWRERQPAAGLARCNAIRDKQVIAVDRLRAFCAKPGNFANVMCHPTESRLQYPPPCVLKPVCGNCPRPIPM